jgi:NADPH:quinone reductase
VRAVAVRSFRAVPELLDLPPPVPGDDEIGVRIEAAGVNPLDWKIVDGIYDGRRPHVFPLVVGIDAAGVVESTGPSVRRFRVGDRVCGQFLHDPVGVGTWAEHVTAPERIGVATFPAAMTAAEAAALPTSGMTAIDALDLVKVPPRGTLLVVGASGGVGSFVTQLAAHRGIRVIATARSGSEVAVRRLGASEIVDPGGPELAGQVRARCPEGVDGLVDAGSDNPTFARLATLVRHGGTAVTTTFVADVSAGAADGIHRVNLDLHPRHEMLERLMSEIRAGGLDVPVARTLPLDEGPRALADSRARTSVGKTVLTVS